MVCKPTGFLIPETIAVEALVRTGPAGLDLNPQPPVLEFSPVFCVWLRLAPSARVS